MPKIAHPHITSDPAICGGSAVIHGTRFPVRSVVTYVLQHGCTPEELIAKFPHLTLSPLRRSTTRLRTTMTIDLRSTGKLWKIVKSTCESNAPLDR
ncbi:MAG: DUF433 domain-containing protein [Nitrospiraceae bacterium]